MTTQRGTQHWGWTGAQGVESGGVPPAELIAIFEAVEEPVLVLRHDLTVATFNRAAAHLLNLLPSHVGRGSREITALARFPHLEEHCARVTATRTESRADFHDGDKWFVVRLSPYSTGDRPAAGTVLAFTNVTAFRAIIDQAIYDRECTKAILNTVADPLVVLSADQRIQSGNRAFYTMFGVSRDETRGIPLYELGNGAFGLAPVRSQLDAMLAGSHPVQPVEVEMVFLAGEQRTLLLDARPLSLPGHLEPRTLVTFQDITARKRAQAAKDLRSEEELRRSEAFLAEGQRLSLTGSFSWKVDTDEITWSEQLYRTYEVENGVPVTLDKIWIRVHPEDVSLLERMLEQARSGIHDFEWQYRLVMPDGSIKYLQAVAHATRDHDGRLEYIAAVQDVTARRLSEDALARTRSELAKVTRATSLGMLTASIAHEVNQPLAGIITNAGTCLRMLDAEPANLEGARETARRTIRDGNRAADVITRLRALFRQEEFALEPLDLNQVLAEIIALSLSDLQRNQIVLQSEFADDLPPITGDRVQLQQVVLNLLRNASDAMISVNDRPRRLVVRTVRDRAGDVHVSVQDSGVGVRPESMHKLFDAFYTTKRDGMGIGLSISRSIIERHHGRLWAVQNSDGPGATFAFSVPCEVRAS